MTEPTDEELVRVAHRQHSVIFSTPDERRALYTAGFADGRASRDAEVAELWAEKCCGQLAEAMQVRLNAADAEVEHLRKHVAELEAKNARLREGLRLELIESGEDEELVADYLEGLK